jgi:Na+-driven multidrug efflux pump
VLCIPLAYVLSRYSSMNILTMYILVYAMDLIKAAVGFVLVKKQVWVKNLVKE